MVQFAKFKMEAFWWQFQMLPKHFKIPQNTSYIILSEINYQIFFKGDKIMKAGNKQLYNGDKSH